MEQSCAGLPASRRPARAEDAVKLAPGNPVILDTLGWILVDSSENGDPARGLAFLRQALAKTPDARDIRYHLAAGLKKTGDLDGARKELAALMKGDMKFAQAADARALQVAL
jgi:cytochrome c-type biogenesis protein CcmH/NrfG